jgi:arylformamidase
MPPWSRRECLRAALLGAAGGALPARAQDAAHVWLDMDQAALDDAYDQAVYAPNMALVLEQQTAMNAAAAARLGAPQRLSYGPGAIERVDVYRADVPAAPLHVFIHGGTWRVGTADEFAFVAEPFIDAGAHAVIVDFSPVEEAPEGLATLVRQVREAVAWVYRHAEEIGGDPARLFVSGHSSGGHLAAAVLTTDWRADFDLPPDVVRGGLCISGMFDLEPVRLSWRNAYLRLDPAEVEALSPQRRLEHLHAPIILAYGTQETPEFQRQSRDFAAALRAADKRVDLIVGQALNHFEMLGTLANPYGLVGRAALVQMGLA